nr:hypothetical protein [uncultured Mediterranean phage uvMED]BAR25760.1 hypothetical protein [uncultured Mediterranean phage uvMED]
MPYATTLRMVKGDTLPELTLSLKDSNTAATGQVLNQEDSDTFAAVDVSGGVVKARIREIGTTTILKTITTTITDATNGKVAMTFPADTFPAAGAYEAEIEFTKSNGDIQTVVDLIKFNVRDDFD